MPFLAPQKMYLAIYQCKPYQMVSHLSQSNTLTFDSKPIQKKKKKNLSKCYERYTYTSNFLLNEFYKQIFFG